MCLSFPLAPAPPALFQNSGEMHKTAKSALANTIKALVEPEYPLEIDVELIDGFYFLHRLRPIVPQTFGKIAEFILKQICNTKADEIHLIFDNYISPSIKDIKRKSRDEIDVPYTIIGPSQSRPINFLKSLKNKKFKDSLVEFLSKYRKSNDVATILGEVYLTVGKTCYSYVSENGKTSKVE